MYHKDSRRKVLALDKPPNTKDKSIFLTYSIEITSTEKQQTALHFWSLTAPSCNSGSDGDPEAFGLHRAALGRPRLGGGELESANTCAQLPGPPSADPEAISTKQGHLGRESPSPCPGGHQEAAGSPCLPSDLAQPHRAGTCSSTWRVSPGLKVSKQLVELSKRPHTLLGHTEKPLLTQVSAHGCPVTLLCQKGQQGAEPARAELHHSLTLQHTYKFCYDIRYLLKQQIRTMPLLEL